MPQNVLEISDESRETPTPPGGLGAVVPPSDNSLRAVSPPPPPPHSPGVSNLRSTMALGSPKARCSSVSTSRPATPAIRNSSPTLVFSTTYEQPQIEQVNVVFLSFSYYFLFYLLFNNFQNLRNIFNPRVHLFLAKVDDRFIYQKILKYENPSLVSLYLIAGNEFQHFSIFLPFQSEDVGVTFMSDCDNNNDITTTKVS